MKKILFAATVILLFLNIGYLLAQPATIDVKKANSYFNLFKKTALNDNGKLWGKSLFGPMMFVNPENMEMVANSQLPDSSLKAYNGLFYGIFKERGGAANTSIKIQNENWTMCMWPLPEKTEAASEIMMHEAFHSKQKTLGFTMNNPSLAHMNTKNARILFRLEIEALHIASTNNIEALKDALLFRYLRFKQFPDGALLEVLLETCEGIAQYTGFKFACNTGASIEKYHSNQKARLTEIPTLARSAAYFTGPYYGQLFDILIPDWKKRLSNKVDFLKIGMEIKNINPHDLESIDYSSIRAKYNYSEIEREESEREVIKEGQLAEFRRKYLGADALTLPLEEMNINFNPSNLVPLDDKGTVYPNCKVIAVFGELETTNGAMISSDWKYVTVAAPMEINGEKVKGDGWEIKLNENYIVEKTKSGNYELKRNHK